MIDDFRALDFEEAWNVFKSEISMTDSIYRKVRFGITHKFDVNDHFKGRILIKGKAGLAVVRGKTIGLEDYETELELREREVKKWLQLNLTTDEVVSPRGNKGGMK